MQYNATCCREYAMVLGQVKTTAKAGGSLTDIFIKIMHFISACGAKGRLVCVLAVPDLPKDAWVVADLKGFNNDGRCRRGRLYACHSRCGTAEMWRDYLSHVVLPEIKEQMDYYDTGVRTQLCGVTCSVRGCPF